MFNWNRGGDPQNNGMREVQKRDVPVDPPALPETATEVEQAVDTSSYMSGEEFLEGIQDNVIDPDRMTDEDESEF
jgi:hypothetical protein